MKIYIILAHYYPVIGGKEKAILNYAKELQNEGHDVTVLSSDYDRNGKRVKDEKNGVYEGVKYRKFRGVAMVGPTAVFFPSLIGFLLYSKYDLIITNTYRQPHTEIALFCAKIKKKKCFLMTHNSMIHRRKGLNRHLVNLYDKLIAPIALKHYDKIICISSISFDFFKIFRINENRLGTVPLGVENLFFQRLSLNEGPYVIHKSGKIILHVGNMYDSGVKGQDLLIKAIPYIQNEVIVYFIGEDEGFKEKMQKEIESNKLTNVVVLDKKPPADLLKYYQFADLFVLPSRSEGFGIAALEALATGLPVVVTKYGLLKSIINEKVGEVTDPFDAKQLAESIDNQLAREHDKKDSICLATEYTWKNAGKKLNKIITAIST